MRASWSVFLLLPSLLCQAQLSSPPPGTGTPPEQLTQSQSQDRSSDPDPQSIIEPSPSSSRFHYLVPATRSNPHLCRLLASAAATGFPPPVLLMWDAVEEQDEYRNHMKKIDAIYNHLTSLPAEHDNDLVLIIDGYDIWHQLPPSLLIKRYREVIAASNARLTHHAPATRNSVLFGPDKICWPEDPGRAACWAVPDSPLPRWAFGPDTDSGAWRNANRPRWLNSGTILGPVHDVRRVVAATRQLIATNRTVDSDQFYFATLWGRQEYMRRVTAGEHISPSTAVDVPIDWAGRSARRRVHREIPTILDDEEWEHGITIDHTSSLFQTVAYYADFLHWSAPATLSPAATNAADLSEIPMPLSHLSPLAPDSIPTRPWHDLHLGTNAASAQVFALIHFTPPKSLRALWWPRMWFFTHLRRVVAFAFMPDATTPLYTHPNGARVLPHLPIPHSLRGPGVRALVYADGAMEWREWADMCGAHEDEVFHE